MFPDDLLCPDEQRFMSWRKREKWNKWNAISFGLDVAVDIILSVFAFSFKTGFSLKENVGAACCLHTNIVAPCLHIERDVASLSQDS